MIKIISYGAGNIEAIANIYRLCSIPFEIVTSPAQLRDARKLVLPGVGAFDHTIELLKRSQMYEVLDELVTVKRVPVLGVCVGMQIMAKSSEEGSVPGLGWIDAEVVRLTTEGLKCRPFLPHMGWNSVRPTRDHAILEGVDVEKGFYFLHSYCFSCKAEEDVLCYTDYGQSFPSAVQVGHIYGFQFHPEKSHQNGVCVFRNFAKI